MVSSATRVTNRLRVGTAAALAGIVAAISITFADPTSPIALTNVDSPDPVASGGELTYTITGVNTGGSKLTNVVLTSQLNNMGGIGNPPQFVLTSTRGSCTQNVSLITCNAGSIEGNGTWVVTIRGKVTAASGTTINNTASVSGTRSAQNFTTTASASTLVSGGTGTPLPDLTINKTGPTSVATSAPIAYTLTINNQGTAAANDIKVVDTLPAGLSNVTTVASSLFVCSTDEPPLPHAPVTITVSCINGRVNFGTNATITVNATSPSTSGNITNTASVDPDGTIPESDELNNTSALVNTVVGTGPGSSALTIDKTDADLLPAAWDNGAGPDPVSPGTVVTYKILVTNTATTRADDVMMVDGTTGLEAASISISQVVTNGTVGNSGGCTVTAPEAKCLARTLNPGGTIVYTVAGQVVGSAGSSIINTATVTGNIRNVGVSSTDTERTTVRPLIDLTITKAGQPDPVCASSFPTTLEGGAEPVPASPPLIAPAACLGGLKYTLVVGNSGVDPAGATGVVVRDELPAGTTFDHVSGDIGAFAGGCSAAGTIVTCSGGSIPKESTKTLFLWVVAPAAAGPITNKATVDPNNAIWEPDETNNSASVTTQVTTGVDLVITKDDSPPKSPEGFDPIATSGTQTYVIKVDNVGPQSVSNIMVRDTLPAGTRFRSAQGDHGFTCSQTSPGVVDCIGGSLPGTFQEFYADLGEQQATITIKLFAQDIVGTMHNEARVDPLNQIPEINEGNNIAVQDTTVTTGGSGQGAFNEFSITKTQTKPTPVGPAVARNAKMTFQVKTKNDGTDPATGVTVRDFLPAGAQYIEATGTNHFLCNQVNNYIECTGGELGKIGSGTEEATITISMFAPDTPGSYTNQAIVDPANAIPEGNEFNNQANATFTVANGGLGPFNDLTISKTPKDITVRPEDVITYILSVQNIGEAPALNVAVRDVLPAGVTFLSADDTTAAPGGFTCSEAGGVINCSGATLDGSANTLSAPDIPDNRVITVKVKAPNFNVPNKGLINQATVDPNNTVAEGDETNNSDDSKITVASAIDLRIEKNGPTESNQNQVTQYTLKVFNDKADGTGQDAVGVQVFDPLPVGLIPLSVFTSAGSNFTCTVSENPINLVQCVGDIPAGKDVTVTIDVFMTAEGSRKLDNEACVDPNDTIEESNELNNCSTATTLGSGTQPKIKPDLLVVKSVSPSGPITAGQALTYTVTVSNVGDAKAAGELTVTDKLPDHVTFVNQTTTNGWSCTFTSPNLVCHDGDDPNNPGTKAGLDVGASATITILATYDGGATAPIVNQATADAALVDGGESGTQQNEQNLANNTAFAKNSVGTTGIDLVLSKIVDQPDPVAIGGKLTYTTIVVNGGSEDSTTSGHEVVVRLDGPVTGVIFLSATGSNGFNCGTPNGSGQIECKGDLPAGGDTTLTVEYTVVGGAPQDLQMTGNVDPGNQINETNEGNNTLTEKTTVAGDSCASPSPCIDLVAAQLIGSPATYVNNGTVTMSFIIVNTGDAPTTLDPTDPLQPLAFFDLSGAHASFTRTVTPSNPASTITCSTDASSTPNANVLSNCYGNLGPGEGVKITVVLTGVTSNSVSASGTADPLGLVAEFLETNNNLTKTVIKQ